MVIINATSGPCTGLPITRVDHRHSHRFHGARAGGEISKVAGIERDFGARGKDVERGIGEDGFDRGAAGTDEGQARSCASWRLALPTAVMVSDDASAPMGIVGAQCGADGC